MSILWHWDMLCQLQARYWDFFMFGPPAGKCTTSCILGVSKLLDTVQCVFSPPEADEVLFTDLCATCCWDQCTCTLGRLLCLREAIFLIRLICLEGTGGSVQSCVKGRWSPESPPVAPALCHPYLISIHATSLLQISQFLFLPSLHQISICVPIFMSPSEVL